MRLLSQFVEEMDLTDLYSTYSRIWENQANPRKMLKIVLYSYMNHNYSSRLMETSCKRDINFMYLLEGMSAPDHSTFARFRSLHFALCSERIMPEMTNFFYDIKEISGDAIFIDGTKIEACANKYTFVWKKAVSKNLEKLKEYTQKMYICGERNSYSKTDNDATFMRMKEDAMGNGQLKAGYNVQYGVDSEYITWLAVGPQPTDTVTLIPFLESMKKHLKFKYKKIVADAGYESEENYVYLKNNEQLSFIKPANYEISKTRKYKTDIGIIDNMEYNADGDYYVCKNGKRLLYSNTIKRKSKTGYQSEKTIYTCEECSNCLYKSKCIKGNNCKKPLEDRVKNIETSKIFNGCRKENPERILTDEGCKLRMNRSIQAEGSFGELKQDMSFRRFMCKGKQNVLAESILLAMAHNINKLHNKIQSGRTGTHLYALKESA